MPVFALEGVIERGDYDKLKKYISSYGYMFNDLYIASKGGDIVEAMKIGYLIRELQYRTSAPLRLSPVGKIHSFDVKDKSNDVCASACFFIYVAGVNRNGNLIGIHRPYLPKEYYKKMGIDDAFSTHAKLKKIIIKYFEDMGVPRPYVDRMFSVPKEEIEWLSEDEIDKYFDGYIPEMDEWIKARCPTMTKKEELDIKTPFGKKLEIYGCKTANNKKISCKKWSDFIKPKSKLRDWCSNKTLGITRYEKYL